MKTATILLLTAALLAPSLAAAETPVPARRDRARTFLVLRLAEELNLPDDKALQLRAILQRSEERRRELRARRGEVEKQVRAALDKTPPDDATLARLVAQANEIDRELAQIPNQSVAEAQKILTVEQQGRLVLLRPEMQQEIRRAWGRRAERRARKPRDD